MHTLTRTRFALSLRGRIGIAVLLVLVLFFATACRKDPIYELQQVDLRPPSPDKDQFKTNEEYVAILYANMFQTGLSANEVYEMAQCIESIGDKELAREVVISNFMNKPGGDHPQR